LKEARPLQDTGLPEGHRQGYAKHELGEPWLRDPSYGRDRLVDQSCEAVQDRVMAYLRVGSHLNLRTLSM
jgi:hypothetical protein